MLELETADFPAGYPSDFFSGNNFQLMDRQEWSAGKVVFPSVLCWKAHGFDLTLANCELFDPAHFATLIDNFEAAVCRGKNAGLVADLRKWASRYCTMPWLHASNALLLQQAMTDRYGSAVPQANAIWTYLFGSPAPAWYRWNQRQGDYKFDSNCWQIWFNSLNQG